MEQQISQIQKDYLEKIREATGLKQLDEIFLALFGKKGELTLLPKDFGKLYGEEKRKVSPLFNLIKQELQQAIEKRRNDIREEGYKNLEQEEFSLQPRRLLARRLLARKGYLHPLTQIEQETAEIFKKIGFSQFEAPHIDTDYNNFEVLNIPKNHPARDLWDTLYIIPGKLLLRTHTSNSQIRILKQYKPPIRLMNIGRCFRYEAVDSRHEHTFEQFELVYVDKNVSMANLQYLSEYFLRGIFGEEVKVRLKPKYYPFVEPGVGVDGLCIFCKGQGCKVCGGVGWLELAGAGMIHPKVLKAGGIDPQQFSGIAWGFGPPRMAMLKFSIEDIRLFNSGDLRFLQK